MAGSARIPNHSGKAGYATVVHTNSQTNTSTKQQLTASTPLHYPCKICGKVFNKVKSRSAHMKSHRQIPSPDSMGQESRKLQLQQQHHHNQQQQQQQQQQAKQLSGVHHGQQSQHQGHVLMCAQDYHHHHQLQQQQQQQQHLTSCDVQTSHVWHNPPRLRPP